MSEQDTATLGAMADMAEELDEIVAEAMRTRQWSGWRLDTTTFESVERIAADTGRTFHEAPTDGIYAYISGYR